MSVTACIITRNHEQSLDYTIRSVSEAVSEVLVIDTGSSDGTIALAQSRGARVEKFPWADDFSAACNFAIEQAKGDWILSINPDEALNPTGVAPLIAAVARSDVFAFRVRIQQELRQDRAAFGTADQQYRLLRRDPEVRYHHRLHPEFVTPLDQLATNRGQNIADLHVVIHRYAYLSKPTPDKIRWVVRLLEAELRDRPGQMHFLIELGRNLLLLNDPRGHEVLAQAAELVRDFRESAFAPHQMVGQLFEYLLSVSPQQSKSSMTRDEVRELAAKWFSFTPPILWALAGERFASQDFLSAQWFLQRLLELGKSQRYDTAGGFDPEIVGRLARLNLAVCFTQLRRWDEAREALRPLLNDATHGPKAREILGVIDEHNGARSVSDGSA